jgi:hypothetical protein
MAAAAAQAACAGYHPLEYEQQIVEELTAEDGLCITAAGLGWHRVVAAMLAMHDDPEHGEVMSAHTPQQRKSCACACTLPFDPIRMLAMRVLDSTSNSLCDRRTQQLFQRPCAPARMNGFHVAVLQALCLCWGHHTHHANTLTFYMWSQLVCTPPPLPPAPLLRPTTTHTHTPPPPPNPNKPLQASC